MMNKLELTAYSNLTQQLQTTYVNNIGYDDDIFIRDLRRIGQLLKTYTKEFCHNTALKLTYSDTAERLRSIYHHLISEKVQWANQGYPDHPLEAKSVEYYMIAIMTIHDHLTDYKTLKDYQRLNNQFQNMGA